MLKCSYPNCQTLRSDNRNLFFGFPEGSKEGLEVIGYPNFIPSKDDVICQRHFSSDCFANDFLKADAIPFTFEGTSLKDHPGFEFYICRICCKSIMAQKNDEEMTYIFDEDFDICEKISKCLPIIVNKQDGLPQSICDNCYKNLEIAYNLIETSVVSDVKLRKYFGGRSEKDSVMGSLPLNGPIKCDKCNVNFVDMSLFDEHILFEHQDAFVSPSSNVPLENIRRVCTDCGYIFSKENRYTEHKTAEGCSCHCGFWADTQCLLNCHKCFITELSNDEFETEQPVERHVLEVHSENLELVGDEQIENNGPIKVECSPELDLPNGKNRQRTKKELYHCNVCNIDFASNKDLRCHCKDAHGTSNVLWICKFCGKSMTTKVSLQIHQRIHLGTKPFICEWCGNEYRSKANLNQHQAVHTGIKTHVCPSCGKTFSRKSFVRLHMRTHTGERPYVCDICGHRFTQLGDMKRHRLRHASNLDGIFFSKQTVRTRKVHRKAMISEDVQECDLSKSFLPVPAHGGNVDREAR